MNAPISNGGRNTSNKALTVETTVLTLVLHALLVVSVVSAMHRVDEVDRYEVLAPMAVLGLLLGYWLVIARIQDFVAHSIALWTGAVSSVFAAALSGSSPAEIVESRGRTLTELTSGVIRSLLDGSEKPVDDRELLVALGLLAWLVAYTSAWVLYRRGMFGAAIAGPAVVLMTFIQVDDRNGGIPLALFLFAAICLAARGYASERTARWSRQSVPTTAGLPRRFLIASLPLAALVVLLGLAIAPRVHGALDIPKRQSLEDFWSSSTGRLQDVWTRDGSEAGSYPNFPDSFVIGGELNLSDEVVAEVVSDVAHYLAVRRYDNYDGRGWYSDVISTFRLPGENTNVKVTSVGYPASRTVALSRDVTGERTTETVTITVIRPKGDLLFTIETFSSSSREVYAILGWKRLDNFEIDPNVPGDVPVDLLRLVASVKGADAQLVTSSGAVELTDPDRQLAFETARDELKAYPVTAELTFGVSGELLLVVSGRIPNYDDVEAVFTQPELESGEQYQVSGSQSIASVEQLMAAPATAPDWVTARYLQNSDTVTQLTRELALTIAQDAGAESVFEIVWAIQEHLRSGYTYQINGPPPGSGQDLVDYFLFDYPYGRCEQFATAMVVMLRTLGVPSRLVSGYSGSAELINGQYVYREDQAHTWIEVYFPTYGWVPFEPTPSQAGFAYGTGGNTSTPADVEPTDASPTPDSSTEAEPEETSTLEASPIPPTLNIDTSNDGRSWKSLVYLLLVLAGPFAILVGGGLLLDWRLRTRGLSPAGSLLARLQRVGGWFGVKPSPSTTPNEFVRALTRVLPGAENAAKSISAAYYVEQFGPEPERARAMLIAETGWKTLKRNLLRWRLRRSKL